MKVTQWFGSHNKHNQPVHDGLYQISFQTDPIRIVATENRVYKDKKWWFEDGSKSEFGNILYGCWRGIAK